jgi:hypothetical protein
MPHFAFYIWYIGLCMSIGGLEPLFFRYVRSGYETSSQVLLQLRQCNRQCYSRLAGEFDVVFLSQNWSVTCKIWIKQHVEFYRHWVPLTYKGYRLTVWRYLRRPGKGPFKFFIIIYTPNVSREELYKHFLIIFCISPKMNIHTANVGKGITKRGVLETVFDITLTWKH